MLKTASKLFAAIEKQNISPLQPQTVKLEKDGEVKFARVSLTNEYLIFSDDVDKTFSILYYTELKERTHRQIRYMCRQLNTEKYKKHFDFDVIAFWGEDSLKVKDVKIEDKYIYLKLN